MGLYNIKRCADRFSLQSVMEVGTRLAFEFYTGAQRRPAAEADHGEVSHEPK